MRPGDQAFPKGMASAEALGRMSIVGWTQTELLMGVHCTVIREATHAYLIVTVPATQLAGIVIDFEAADGVTVPSICFRPGWDYWGQGAWVTDCDWSD